MSELNPRSIPSSFQGKRTKKNRLKSGKALRMLEVMDKPAAKDVDKFISSGRAGRRNAMADIMSINANTSTADLPTRLQAMSTMPSKGSGTTLLSSLEGNNPYANVADATPSTSSLPLNSPTDSMQTEDNNQTVSSTQTPDVEKNNKSTNTNTQNDT